MPAEFEVSKQVGRQELKPIFEELNPDTPLATALVKYLDHDKLSTGDRAGVWVKEIEHSLLSRHPEIQIGSSYIPASDSSMTISEYQTNPVPVRLYGTLRVDGRLESFNNEVFRALENHHYQLTEKPPAEVALNEAGSSLEAQVLQLQSAVEGLRNQLEDADALTTGQGIAKAGKYIAWGTLGAGALVAFAIYNS